MSGEPESKKLTIDEKLVKIAALLKAYPEKIGLGLLRPINEVHRFLTMSITEQRKLSAEECGEAAVVLNQEAVYVQLENNRIQADINWCEEYIKFIIAKNIASVGGKYTPFEYRKVLAIQQDDVAMKLHGIITNATLKLDAMQYIPNQLRGVSKSFGDLQQTKRSQRA